MSVVVTGMGVVSALGGDAKAFRHGLADGVNACRAHEWPRFDGSVIHAPAYRAATPEPEDLIEPRKLRRMFRLARMSAVAARQALRQAGLAPETLMPSRLGVCFGTSFGALETTQKFVDSWLTQGQRNASPLQFMNSVHGILASQIALDINAAGVNLTTAQRDICFEAALDTAAWLLEAGRADVILVGGADELTPMLHEVGSRTYQLELDRNAPGLDPWSGRGAVIPGEGAAVFVLEREDTPRKALGRIAATTVGRHDGKGEDVALRAWREAGKPGLSLVTDSRDGGARAAALYRGRQAVLSEVAGEAPVFNHRGSFGTFPAAGALQFAANLLMLSGAEAFAPLAGGTPRAMNVGTPAVILHDAASISGNHAAYVLESVL